MWTERKEILCLKRKLDSQSTAGRGKRGDGSAVGDNGVFYNGQTETGAAEFSLATLVNAIKPLKKVGKVQRCNPRTVVG